MTRGQFVTLALALWVGAGLATALWLARRGHRDPLWLLSAVVLGPTLAVIAPERIERRPRLLTAEPQEPPAAGTRVLVGIDGSPESEAALQAVLRLFHRQLGQLLAVEVVDYDTAELDSWGRKAAADEHLAAAGRACGEQRVVREVVAGPPAQALIRCAEEQSVDLIAVGRHSGGLSARLLGSVVEELVRKAPVPVLVVGTAPGAVTAGPPAAGSRPGSRQPGPPA